MFLWNKAQGQDPSLSLEMPYTLSSLLVRTGFGNRENTVYLISMPAPLLWAFSWKVPRTHSVPPSFHPTQTWSSKGSGIMWRLFPLSCDSSTGDRHVRVNLSSTGKVTVPCTVSAPCLIQPTQRRKGRGNFWLSSPLIPLSPHSRLSQGPSCTICWNSLGRLLRWWFIHLY